MSRGLVGLLQCDPHLPSCDSQGDHRQHRQQSCAAFFVLFPDYTNPGLAKDRTGDFRLANVCPHACSRLRVACQQLPVWNIELADFVPHFLYPEFAVRR
jgi:hypothetical protein